jgi:hypothetical protein
MQLVTVIEEMMVTLREAVPRGTSTQPVPVPMTPALCVHKLLDHNVTILEPVHVIEAASQLQGEHARVSENTPNVECGSGYPMGQVSAPVRQMHSRFS